MELYPRAAVLTSWFNAWQAGVVDGLAECPVVRPDDPFHGAEAGLPMWQHARLPLGTALSLLSTDSQAFAVLPVPGDPAGLPSPVAPRAADAGQAMMIPLDHGTVVVTPTMTAEQRTVWHASLVRSRLSLGGDVRSERLTVMELLADAVAIVESATLPITDGQATSRQVAGLAAVPMPPGSAGGAVELARSSATLLTIVAGALAALGRAGGDSAELRDALVPLGRAGRRALAVAFSRAGGEGRR